MMRKFFFIFIFLFFGQYLRAQTTVAGSFVHEGIERFYKIYVPELYDGLHPVPVVFNLHGLFVNADIQAQVADFRPIADTAGFLIVLPDGATESGYQSWNTGFSSSPADDVSFLEALIDTLAAHYKIDPSRIYATGYSNGGFMCYLLACSSTRFAAVASVSGTMMNDHFNTCFPVSARPVMHIHGTSDNIVAYNGNIAMVSVADLMNRWVEIDSCQATCLTDSVPDIDPGDNVTAIHYIYSSNINSAGVEHFKIIGGGHTWPGSSFYLPFGASCNDFNACTEIWRFFCKHENPAYAGLSEMYHTSFFVYPNPVSDVINFSLSQDAIISVQIFDLQGQMLYNRNVCHSNSEQISLAGLPSGIYFTRVAGVRGTFSMKFVKY
ncbi:MAG TPA: T9SS type A sorting domain-containing protein [Bacteroidales bacterium]|nr:T9SS type A sorting domain-containing protein [Bacteroidales bacterium]